MMARIISGGTVHTMPADLRKILVGDANVLALWEDITPLARNEFICWVENAKLIETRTRRLQRTHDELLEGKRRPCCWVGCTHRADKPLSPSARWVLGRHKKAK